jgi:hypothetical protein
LDFSVREAANAPVPKNPPEPKQWINWNYIPGNPDSKMAVDRDGTPVLLWMPQFLPKQAQVSSE